MSKHYTQLNIGVGQSYASSLLHQKGTEGVSIYASPLHRQSTTQSALTDSKRLGDSLSGTRQRSVEVGFFDSKVDDLHIQLLFESFPVWLLLIDSISCSMISFICVKSFDEIIQASTTAGHSTLLLCKLLERMSHKAFQFCERVIVDQNTLLLVNGSFSFVTQQCALLPKNVQTIGVIDSHFSSRLRHGKPTRTGDKALQHIQWHRVRHVNVGGATDYIALFAIIGLSLEVVTSPLKRFVRDFFNTQIRPTIAPSGPVVQENVYGLGSILTNGAYLRPVVHQTHFYCTGWGSRVLTLPELGTFHGFSRDMCQYLDILDLIFPPIQLLSAVFIPAKRSFIFSRPSKIKNMVPVTPVLEPIIESITSAATESSWLPNIQRYLSHDWIDASLAECSIKNDNALTPSHLWDMRLFLLYPEVQLHHLNILRSWLLGRIRRRLYLELICFLNQRHSSDWLPRLLKVRGTLLKERRLTTAHRGGGAK